MNNSTLNTVRTNFNSFAELGSAMGKAAPAAPAEMQQPRVVAKESAVTAFTPFPYAAKNAVIRREFRKVYKEYGEGLPRKYLLCGFMAALSGVGTNPTRLQEKLLDNAKLEGFAFGATDAEAKEKASSLAHYLVGKLMEWDVLQPMTKNKNGGYIHLRTQRITDAMAATPAATLRPSAFHFAWTEATLGKWMANKGRYIPKMCESLLASVNKLGATGYKFPMEWVDEVVSVVKKSVAMKAHYKQEDGENTIGERCGRIAKEAKRLDGVFYIPHTLDHRTRAYGVGEIAPTADSLVRYGLRMAQPVEITPDNEKAVLEAIMLQVADAFKIKGSANHRIVEAAKVFDKANSHTSTFKKWYKTYGLNYQGFAAIRELKCILLDGATSTDFICWQDATQSGAQHISLGFRDRQLATLTNLTAADRDTTPQDFYGKLAELMDHSLLDGDRNLIKGAETRKQYCAGVGVIEAALEAALVKKGKKFTPHDINVLEALLHKAEVKCAPIMQRYRSLMGKLVDSNNPEELFFTIDGTTMSIKELLRDEIRFGRYHVYTDENAPVLDGKAMASAIAANFTHAYDAALMHRVCNAHDGFFANVHDSFGTSPDKFWGLNKTIRTEMMGLHIDNPMADVIAEMGNVDAPEVGDFNVLEVAQAINMFG